MVDLLDIYCRQYPKSLEITYNSHSIVDCVITMFDSINIDNNEFEDLKKMVQILISNGADINYKNDLGYSLIFPSIQYGNDDFVKFMIGLGAKIRELIVNKNNEFPPFINNDPHWLAVQLGYLKIVKVLIEHNAILHIIVKKKY